MGQSNGIRRVTLQDIARETVYSINTVSHALRNKDDIARETRERIQRVAQDMGYMGNQIASSLRSGRTRTLAVILGNMSNPFYGIMTDSIQDAAAARNYSLLIMCSRDRAAQEETSLELGIFSRADGTYLGNVGLINLSAYHRSAEISYFIHPDHWGKGYATEAAAELLRYGFATRNYYRIAGTCMSRNPASQRVMEKLGFRVEGVARGELWKDGQFLDVTHLALLRSEWEASRR